MAQKEGALLWEKIDLPLFLAPPTAPRTRGAAGSLITGVIMLRTPEEREGGRERGTKSFSKRQKHDISTCPSVPPIVVVPDWKKY